MIDEPSEITASRTAPARVRSFVKRGGRTTASQKNALRVHFSRFGVAPHPINTVGDLFESAHPVTLEIGFGSGTTLLHAAQTHPERNFLGMEVYEPGIGRVMKHAYELDLKNLRVMQGDAVELLELLPESSLHAVWVFFPDPWPKKRHHKRRIITSEFAQKIAGRLAIAGHLLLATDWEDYALSMLETLDGVAALENSAGAGKFADRPRERVDSRFATRGLRLGHSIWDLRYRRSSLPRTP